MIACIKYRLTNPHRTPELDSLRNPREPLAGLAIPVDQAHAIWGYGVVRPSRSLRPTDKATEPVQWVERSTVGLHRANDTTEGRLVRLADLVRWLMAAYQLPRVEALEHVLDRFNFRPLRLALPSFGRGLREARAWSLASCNLSQLRG